PNVGLAMWEDKKHAPSRTSPITLSPDEQAIKVSCQVHGWMVGWVRAYDHPYFAITSVGASNLKDKDHSKRVWEDLSSKDVGTFDIKNVPIGARVTLRAWHEDLGFFYNQEITVEKDMKVEITAKK